MQHVEGGDLKTNRAIHGIGGSSSDPDLSTDLHFVDPDGFHHEPFKRRRTVNRPRTRIRLKHGIFEVGEGRSVIPTLQTSTIRTPNPNVAGRILLAASSYTIARTLLGALEPEKDMNIRLNWSNGHHL